jgi:predicted dehydrogenase
VDELRVAVIGYGLAGRLFHAPVIEATPGLRVTTIVTANAERAAAARARHPSASVVPVADELWAQPDRYDLVVVAAPNYAHESLALAAMATGLPVVIDKPVATSSAAAERLAAAAEASGVPVMPFHNRRWDGDFLTVRRLMREGALGDILRFESRFERWRPTARPSARRELAGADEAGGVLFDLGSHLIDQALALFGPVAAVYAEVERRREEVPVDDDTFVALTHASGVRSHLWASHMAADVGPRLRVLGSSAAYVKHGLDVQAFRLQAGGRPDEPGFGRDPRDAWGEVRAGDESRTVETEPGDYRAFYAGVAATVRDGTPPPVALEDAIAGLRIIEAAFASDRTGAVVRPGRRPGGPADEARCDRPPSRA